MNSYSTEALTEFWGWNTDNSDVDAVHKSVFGGTVPYSFYFEMEQ